MKKLSILSSIVILVACNSAPETKSTPAFDRSTAKADIVAANQQFEQAFVKGDSAVVVALYHSGAKIFPADMPACDRKTIGGMTATVPKMGIKTMKLHTEEVSGGPDEVIETGNYEMGDGSKSIGKGNYIVIWKKEGDKWKMYRDIWNSTAPMATK